MRQVLELMVVSLAALSLCAVLAGCEEDEVAYVSLFNDFNNQEMDFQPQWTICESSYLGVEFGGIDLDATSAKEEVEPGLDYVLMVAAWADPTCAPENCLPIASKNEEEVVDGQTRTIAINLANHQGPCPPQGVEPIPQAQYDRILELWPDYEFKAYDERAENPQCLD